MIPGGPETIESSTPGGQDHSGLGPTMLPVARKEQPVVWRAWDFPGFRPKRIVTSGMMARQYLEEKAPGGRAAYLGPGMPQNTLSRQNYSPFPISALDLDNID
jgi:hypothetical protein